MRARDKLQNRSTTQKIKIKTWGCYTFNSESSENLKGEILIEEKYEHPLLWSPFILIFK
jgi:hypothetical protein